MTLETAAHVGPDGRLELNLPSQFANTDVILTVRRASREPVQKIADIRDPDERQRAWQEFVQNTAGSIQDPTFQRHPQGDYEIREEL
jgi:hypothetical protein